MGQTKEGALKNAAQKAGVSPEEYKARTKNNLKWCVLCGRWQSKDEFGSDSSRWDGLVPSCRESKNKLSKEKYRPSEQQWANGRSFVPARDEDKKQARRRINFFVETGLIPKPNALPCADCGHVWKLGERRHEYDHYLGYSAEHHEHVQPVCTTCHRKRGNGNGKN